MRKLLLLSVLVLVFSCTKKNRQPPTLNQEYEFDALLNPYGVPDSLLVRDSYLVFLNAEKFTPVLRGSSFDLLKDSLAIVELEVSAEKKIQEYLNSKKIKIDNDMLLVSSLSGFVLENSNRIFIRELLSDKENIAFIQQNFRFGMENTRARMQSEVLAQNTRARMQERPDWGYDFVNFTSKAVTYLAGVNRQVSKNNKIWVIDSGIDANHQDLKNLVNRQMSRSFVLRNTNIFDSNPFFDYWGHGTHCAGLAAAKAINQGNRNLIGMNGVAPGAKLVSLKVFGQEGYAEFAWVVEALEYASRRGRLTAGDVISMSLGGRITDCGQDGLMLQMQAISSALNVSIVSAAGNGYFWAGEQSSRFLPACVEGTNIYTIGSIDLDYESTNQAVVFSGFSNYELPPIDWVVPGNRIFSTYPNDNYAVMEGTSMSAALMAGLLYLTGGDIQEKTKVPGLYSENYSYPVPTK
ncbi:S8 family serine peptidase [Algoriphagus aestuariicola]|uniref:S8 family serine peptidase n=1 Tax=Algoriphagus aestuariicola TaxID=1852016 RepID=A0ABS3BPG7_9BACT|nr:S8 family serine peptidase [Algoriphagus aestuariicola]MBN7801053.1 S8 family serine peptidase [Algoriphagus aestuariicola]